LPCVRDGRRFAGQLELVLTGQELFQAFANERVIVDDYDARLVGHAVPSFVLSWGESCGALCVGQSSFSTGAAE